jgi:serine/threonine protein kinase
VSEPKPKNAVISAGQFARVREVFNRAVDVPAADQASFVQAECAGDDAVCAHVLELLSADSAAGGTIAIDGGALVRAALGSADLADPPDGPVPERIGPYRVQRLIGRGGMGVVYLASQSNPDRDVALKILPPGRGSGGLRGRFAREVRVLGRLEHPGIARIYDAGVQRVAGGEISYFAMEYVRGLSLTEFAKANELGIAERVELVAKVADALQHAHTRGVLHRDLKPANILIGQSDDAANLHPAAAAHSTATRTRSGNGGPQPKILDFGVARTLEPDTQHTVLTHHGLLIGTVAYMSPEQLGGDPDAVDTRSDIYALGVILYELFAGSPPHDVMNKPLAEAARIISESDPALLQSLAGIVRIDRDLATITAKAMARDKERRYATASALADDLRRYIRDEPILARPPSTAYQFSKFARRNRGLVIASVAAALAVVSGLIVSSALYIREQRASASAKREASLSTAVRTYLLSDLLTAASPTRMGYEVKMLDVLEHATDGLHKQFADHPEVEAEVRLDLAFTFEQLGKFKESYAQAELALPLFESAAGRDDFRAISTLNQMAQSARMMQRNELALTHANEALTRVTRTFPETDPLVARIYSQVGGVLELLGRHEEAIEKLSKSLAMSEACTEDVEADTIRTLSWLQAAMQSTGQYKKGLEYSKAIVTRNERMHGADHPDSITTRSNLVNALVKDGQFAEAAAMAEDLPGAALKAFPEGHPARGYCNLTAASAMVKAKRIEEAERYALAAYENFVKSFDDVNWVTERAVEALRRIYAGWPGQNEQLTKWSLAAARIRLMVATAAELPASVKLFEAITQEHKAAGNPLADGAFAALLWQHRDELAPPKHERRAAFFANFALLSATLGRPDLRDQSLTLAVEALTYAKDAPAAEALIAAAKAAPQ